MRTYSMSGHIYDFESHCWIFFRGLGKARLVIVLIEKWTSASWTDHASFAHEHGDMTRKDAGLAHLVLVCRAEAFFV